MFKVAVKFSMDVFFSISNRDLISNSVIAFIGFVWLTDIVAKI
jgi:hypothetical protein